ncbi:MAG: peptide ABC transporter substrate-binding protein [Candidatus Doudnabacteria bacterium]
MQSTIFQNFIIELKKIGRGIKKLRFFKFEDLAKVFRVFSAREKVSVLILITIILSDILFFGSRLYINSTKVVPAYGGTFIEGEIGQPRLINPLIAQEQSDKDLTRLVYSGLYKYDGSGNLVPDLALSALEISPDKKQFTTHLKPNLKWQDGQNITADDIVFTISTLQNPDYKSSLRKLWENIKVQKVDQTTVKFISPGTSAPFITNLTLGILPEHVWSKVSPGNFYLTKENLEPVGSGAYFVKEINKAVNGDIHSITLNSYSNYAEGKPFIDTIVLKYYSGYEDLLSGFHAKEVDAIGFIPFDKKIFIDLTRSNVKINQFPVYQYQALFFNQTKSPKVLADSAVRSALAQSVDKDAFINEIYSGLALPASTPILPGQIGYDPGTSKMQVFNIEQAGQRLDSAGWIKNPNGIRSKGNQPLRFSITTNDFVLNVKSAENLQQQWKKIGADVYVNVTPTAELENKYLRTRDFESLLFAESTGHDPDPFVFWHSSQSANPGFNLSQYRNTTIDKLITEARNTFDADVRASKYKDFQNIFLQDLPAIILDQSVFVYEVRPTVQGMSLRYISTPEDRFYDINHWSVETKRSFK